MPQTQHAPPDSARGAVAANLSRAIIRLHAELYGRGPTKAKTYVTDTYILCLLENVFMPAERILIKAGNSDQVSTTRHAFQDAVESRFIELVEEASGRTVRASLSQVHFDPEISAELFLLEPLADETDGAGPMNGAGPHA